MASGRICAASVPAEFASNRSPPKWRSRPSAIWLRAELCVHTKRIRWVASWTVILVADESSKLSRDLPCARPRPRDSSPLGGADLYGYNLARAGHNVRLCTNGALALDQVRTQPPELLLVDLMLPGLGGLEVG